MAIQAQQQLQELYLDWVNNYITVERFAEVHNLSIIDMKQLLVLAKNAHENIVEFHKQINTIEA